VLLKFEIGLVYQSSDLSCFGNLRVSEIYIFICM